MTNILAVAFGVIIGWLSDWLLFRKQLEGESGTLRAELKAAQAQAKDMERKAEGYSAELDDLRSQADTSTDSSEVEELKGKLAAADTELSNLQAKLAEMEKATQEGAAAVEQQAKAAQDEIDALKKQLADAENNSAAEAELKVSQDEIAALKKQLAEAEDDAAATQLQLDDARKQLAAMPVVEAAAAVEEGTDIVVDSTGGATVDGHGVDAAADEAIEATVDSAGAVAVDEHAEAIATEAQSDDRSSDVVISAETTSDEDAADASAPLLATSSDEEPTLLLAADDLLKIEGIGPKSDNILRSVGIVTFAQLAARDAEELAAILKEGGISGLVDPGTWPEQAALAAEGEWDALAKLQEELDGGKKA